MNHWLEMFWFIGALIAIFIFQLKKNMGFKNLCSIILRVTFQGFGFFWGGFVGLAQIIWGLSPFLRSDSRSESKNS